MIVINLKWLVINELWKKKFNFFFELIENEGGKYDFNEFGF